MTKFVIIAACLPVVFGSTSIPGWFVSVPRGGSRHLSPDAVTNVVHGYAHINDKKDTDEVVPVKSSTAKKADTKNDDWENPFFHAVLHNNDRSSGVVTNVVNKESNERVDEELFVKFSKNIFHYPRNGEKKQGDADQDKTEAYGLREFIQDSSLME
ncbi:hypothetical protein ACHAXN_002969 [Cyclotella atomus]